MAQMIGFDEVALRGALSTFEQSRISGKEFPSDKDHVQHSNEHSDGSNRNKVNDAKAGQSAIAKQRIQDDVGCREQTCHPAENGREGEWHQQLRLLYRKLLRSSRNRGKKPRRSRDV